MAKTKKNPRKKKTTSGKLRKWSAGVTERSEGYDRGKARDEAFTKVEHSDALDLEKGVFTLENPEKIAESLERSAENSTRKKGSSYQSAMSMLNFYINRAGKNLPAKKKKVLTKAKDLLKELHDENQEIPDKDKKKKKDPLKKKSGSKKHHAKN
jgi:Protein of unknown function (DUF3175)